jgi:predicted nucleotidyltransferase
MDFARVLQILSRNQVAYVLVGGVAATVHGSARLTQDIDLLYQRSPDNIRRLVLALKPHHPILRDAPPSLPFQWDERTITQGLNFTLTTGIGNIDLFGELLGGGTFESLVSHTIHLNVFGVECACLDLDHLIAAKRAAGRPKDLETVAELEALREEQDKGGTG